MSELTNSAGDQIIISPTVYLQETHVTTDVTNKTEKPPNPNNNCSFLCLACCRALLFCILSLWQSGDVLKWSTAIVNGINYTCAFPDMASQNVSCEKGPLVMLLVTWKGRRITFCIQPELFIQDYCEWSCLGTKSFQQCNQPWLEHGSMLQMLLLWFLLIIGVKTTSTITSLEDCDSGWIIIAKVEA